LTAKGEFALAKEYFEMAGQIPVTRGGHIFQETERYFLMADLAVLQRDEAALRQYAPLAEETALQDNHRLYQAGAHRAWGVLHRLAGEYARAETRLKQALELFQSMETHWQIGRTLSELAELGLAQADPAQAKRYFSQALASFEQIGAKPDAAQTRQALAALSL
jgi:tetratricopeptide (TPR) repeat protein